MLWPEKSPRRAAKPPAEEQILRVSELTAALAALVQDTLPASLMIQGEISNFRTYERGHGFFTLKDAQAEIPCVIWKDALARLKFKPKDGMAVVVRATVKVYEPQSKLQLYIETILPQGLGALELAFRQLCEQLRAEGLFAPERKRSIPVLPQRVVIMTSRSGDVLHDVVTTAQRRFSGVQLLVMPVPVQGANAAPRIAAALAEVNEHAVELGGVDLILLVRGGGSLEDLWAFNEAVVARAIVASTIPIATGIGHEPDTTIADLVGDLRGPTPTGVTELTIPDVRSLLQKVNHLAQRQNEVISDLRLQARQDLTLLQQRLHQVIQHDMRMRLLRVERVAGGLLKAEPRYALAQAWRRLEEAQTHLQSVIRHQHISRTALVTLLTHRVERKAPTGTVQLAQQRLANLRQGLTTALRRNMQRVSQKLEAQGRQLLMLSPQAILERGYSITTDASGHVIRSQHDVFRGDVLTTRLANGVIRSTVGESRQGSLF